MKRISIEEFENKFVSSDGDIYDLGMLEVGNKQELLGKAIEKINGVEYLTIEARMYETFEKDGYQAVRWQDVTITELPSNLINEDDQIILDSLELVDFYQHSNYEYNNWKTLYTSSYTIDSQDNKTEECKSGDTFMFEESQALEMFKKRIGIYDLKKETPFVWCETLRYGFNKGEYFTCDGYPVFDIEMFDVDDETLKFIKNSKNEFVCEV